MSKQEKWWKILPSSLFGFGVFAALLTFLPEYSFPYLVVGGVLAIVASISSVLQRTNKFKRAKVITVHSGLLLIFLLGARQWLFYLPNAWVWLLPMIISYSLAWAIPYLNPKISQILAREQLTPRTSLGKSIERLSWAVLPIVGGGAFLGMFLSRTGEIRTASMLLGPIFMVSSIGFAQVASHQLKEEFQDTRQVFE
jgi:hypothetical protein